MTQFSEAGEAGTYSSPTENAARSGGDEKPVFTGDFSPISNRLELLLYVLRGSKYHCFVSTFTILTLKIHLLTILFMSKASCFYHFSQALVSINERYGKVN